MPHLIYCDFEYRDLARPNPARGQPRLELVLGCFDSPSEETLTEFDLRRPQGLQSLRDYCSAHTGCTFVAYAAHAEVTALLHAGVDVTQHRFICLLAESRQITASHPQFFLPPARTNLLTTLERFGIPTTGNAAHKKAMRDLILAGGEYSEQQWQEIREYGWTDVTPLPALWKAVQAIHAKLRIRYTPTQAEHRGEAIRDQAILDFNARGFPIDTALLDRVYSNRPLIMRSICETVNREFGNVYRFNKAKKSYSFYFRGLLDNLAAQPVPVNWAVTAKSNRLRTDEEYLTEFAEKNPYYKPLVNAMFLLKHFSATDLRQQLIGEFIHGVNLPFHTATSRSQPLVSRGFVLNMQPWLRSMVRPEPNHVLVAADYSQEEIVVATCLSGDRNMAAALATGDIYTSLGHRFGTIPPDGNKKTHPVARQIMKSCLAAGTLVVTDAGPVPIEHVTTQHKLWDGIEWVSHDGLLRQGQQETLTLYGVALTPDHYVWCGNQWKDAQSLVHAAGSHFLQSALSAASLPSPAILLPNEAASPPFWCNAPVVSPNTLSRGTSGSAQSARMPPINAALPISNTVSASLKPVYDLANAGPRHRFTVLTDQGPLIVSNCVLGLGYGMQAASLGMSVFLDLRAQALMLKLPPPILEDCIEQAHTVLRWHRAEFHTFWNWNENVVRAAQRDGYTRALDGWTTFCNLNSRATRLGNFPVQANAAVILRQAIKNLAKHPEIEFVCSLHDSIFIYCHEDTEVVHTNLLIQAMTRAANSVLEHTRLPLPIAIETKRYTHESGYTDERDTTTLPTILNLLAEKGV